jgi:hypothetical protein
MSCDLIPDPPCIPIDSHLSRPPSTLRPPRKSPRLANYPIMNAAHTAIRICAQEMRDRKIRSNPSRPYPHQNKSMRCEEEKVKEGKKKRWSRNPITKMTRGAGTHSTGAAGVGHATLQ